MGKFNSEGQSHSGHKKETAQDTGTTALDKARKAPFLFTWWLLASSSAWSCSAFNKPLNLLALTTLLNHREQRASSVLAASVLTARPLNNTYTFFFKSGTCIYYQLPSVTDHKPLSCGSPQIMWWTIKLAGHSLEVLKLDAPLHPMLSSCSSKREKTN